MTVLQPKLEGKEKKMEGEVNVKGIEHVSDFLYGNNIGNVVNHVVHGGESLNVLGPVHF